MQARPADKRKLNLSLRCLVVVEEAVVVVVAAEVGVVE